MTTIINGSSPSITFSDGSAQTSATRPFLNRIINGNFVIDQRNAGASVTPTTDTYTLDRWQIATNVSSLVSVQQSSTAPTGFTNSTLITSLSAYTIGAGEVCLFRQAIEGYNIADLGFGTANAKTITISFFVRSSLTGTFGGALTNSSENRSFPFTYTISVANTFEYKTITVAGDTSGTWLTTNGAGLKLVFGLGVGSTFSGPANAWAGSAFFSATGATSLVGTNGATFYLTGCQLEVGSTATSFDYRPFGTELALCQRYFWKITKTNPSAGLLNVAAYGGGDCYGVVAFPVPMRTLPTGSYSSLSAFRVAMTGSTTGPSAIVFQDPTTFNTVVNLSRSVTSGDAGWVSFNDPTSSSTDFFAWSAEL